MRNNFKDIFNNYYDKSTTKFVYEINVKKNTFKEISKNTNIKTKDISVLDIGFGFGEMLFCFDKSNNLNGVEISSIGVKRAIRIAKSKGYKDFSFIEEDINRLNNFPFKKMSFDVIICSHVLQYLSNEEFILSEVRRLIKPEGKIIFGMPIKDGKEDDLNKFINNLIKKRFKIIYLLKNDSISNLFKITNKIKEARIKSILSKIINLYLYLIPWVLLSKIDKFLIKNGSLPRQVFLVIENEKYFGG